MSSPGSSFKEAARVEGRAGEGTVALMLATLVTEVEGEPLPR